MSLNDKEVLKKVRKVLEDEGYEFEDKNKSEQEILEEFILPGLKNSKGVLESLYSFQTRKREGLIGRIKSLIQNKIIGTVVNVIEKQSMKQQKFNELTYRAVERLVEENKKLKEKLKIKD